MNTCSPLAFDFPDAAITFADMTTPAYALTRAPEIEKTEVEKIEHRPGHATVRLLGSNVDQSFVLDLPRLHQLAEQIVHVGRAGRKDD